MPNQIFPLNVDPESPLNQIKKKKKPTFKQWFNERKLMLGLVFGVCLVTVGVIVYPYLNLQLFKGQMIDLSEGLIQNYTTDIQDVSPINTNFHISFKSTQPCNVTSPFEIKLIKADGSELSSENISPTKCNSTGSTDYSSSSDYSYNGVFTEVDIITIKLMFGKSLLKEETVEVFSPETAEFTKLKEETVEVFSPETAEFTNITIDVSNTKNLTSSDILNPDNSFLVGDKINKFGWDEPIKFTHSIDQYERVISINGEVYSYNAIQGAFNSLYDTHVSLDTSKDSISIDREKAIDVSIGYMMNDNFIVVKNFTMKSVVPIEEPKSRTDTKIIDIIPVSNGGMSYVENSKMSIPNNIKADDTIKLYWSELSVEYDMYAGSSRKLRLVGPNNFVYDEVEIEVPNRKTLIVAELTAIDPSLATYIQVGETINGAFVEYWNTSKNKIFSFPGNTLTPDELQAIIEQEVKVPEPELFEPTVFEPTVFEPIVFNPTTTTQEDQTSSTGSFTATPSTINIAETQKIPIKFDYNIQNLPSDATVKIIIKNKKSSSIYATFIPTPATSIGSWEWKGNKITCVSTTCTETDLYETGEYFAYIIATIRNPMAAGRTTTFYKSEEVPLTLKSQTTTTLSLTASPLTQVEDQSVTFTVTVTGEASTTRTCTVDYGDNTTSQPLLCATATPVTFTHPYTTPGSYTVTARTNDSITNSISYTITTATTTTTTTTTTTATPKLVFSNLDPDPDDDIEIDEDVEFKLKVENGTAEKYKYTVDWDDDEDDYEDSSTSSTSDSISHSYEEEGDYKIEACVLMTYSDSTTETKCAEDVEYTVVEDSSTTTDDEDEDEEDCTNDKDDDGDGDTDYEDSDCDIPASKAITLSGVQITKSKFNPDVNAAKIIYKLNRDAKVTVEILNTSKKTVVTLLDDVLQKAKNTSGTILSQSVWFNGTVDNKIGSQSLADGPYTYKITAANPSYETITAVREGPVVIDSMDTATGDWEQGTGTTTGTTTTATGTTTTTSTTRSPLSTTTSTSANLAALTMQNAPPTSTAGTGPEMLIYLVLPAISALVLTRKK